MSRKKRTRTASASPASTTAVAPGLVDSQFMSGYDGANWSPKRATVWMPTLDTRLELDKFSREELTRRVRWLVANVGLVRALCWNSARLVGWLTPSADSADRKWNRRIEKRLMKKLGRAATFDLAGKYSFETAQPMLTALSKRDGDILTVLTTTKDGTEPRVAFYESHQLSDPPGAKDGWHAGVHSDAHGRHIEYGLRGSDGKVRIVPAHAVIYHGTFDSPGHIRAVPPLAHAINHAIDITEIRADAKHAAKASGLFGIVRELGQGAPNTKARQGMGGILRPTLAAGAPGNPASNSPIQTRDVWEGGQAVELSPGEKLSTLHDSRPHPNHMAFQDELIRDISIGFGLPPEVILKMVSLTGPGVRFVMEYASRWIENEQLALWNWAERVWWHFLAFEVRTTGFPATTETDDPTHWMDVTFTPQRDLTIDRSRDGRQRMEELDRGLGTEDDWHKSINGSRAADKITARIEEVKFKQEECERLGVPYHLAFPPRAGAAPMPPTDTPDPDAIDDDYEEEEEDEDDEETEQQLSNTRP